MTNTTGAVNASAVSGASGAKHIKNVKFWKSEKGFYLSHNKGLTTEQVEFLKSLLPGDKLIVFAEKDDNGRDILTMKKSTMIAQPAAL